VFPFRISSVGILSFFWETKYHTHIKEKVKLEYTICHIYPLLSSDFVISGRCYVTLSTYMHATIEERCFLCSPRHDRCHTTAQLTRLYNNRGSVFYALSVPRSYLKTIGTHHNPGSRRRWRKGNPMSGAITRPPCSWGI
jgi:hypothetical protein